MKKFRDYISTDAGMWGVWDVGSYNIIDTFELWEKYFFKKKNIKAQIEDGKFVPITIDADGNFDFEIRIGDKEDFETLSERERNYLVVESERYLLRSSGRIGVSGIEAIGNVHKYFKGNSGGIIETKETNYVVKVHLIEWNEEPGMTDEDGFALQGSLPDFVILLNEANQDDEDYNPYCDNIETFPD